MERTQYDAISILPVSMRRFSGIVSLFALIATPMSALALATSPATLLSQMNFREIPTPWKRNCICSMEIRIYRHG